MNLSVDTLIVMTIYVWMCNLPLSALKHNETQIETVQKLNNNSFMSILFI